jgi:hypothetical protein
MYFVKLCLVVETKSLLEVTLIGLGIAGRQTQPSLQGPPIVSKSRQTLELESIAGG